MGEMGGNRRDEESSNCKVCGITYITFDNALCYLY